MVVPAKQLVLLSEMSGIHHCAYRLLKVTRTFPVPGQSLVALIDWLSSRIEWEKHNSFKCWSFNSAAEPINIVQEQ